MPINLPEQLAWRQFVKGMYVLELYPPGLVVGGVVEEHGGRWRTTVAQKGELIDAKETRN